MIEAYRPLLILHMTLAVLSPVLFSIRVWRASRGLDPAAGLLRVVPHVVDTFLLLAGIGLALTIRQYPFVHAWLTAKVLALVAYIVAGHIAVRRVKTPNGRLAAWLAAIAIILYIYAVAGTKSATLNLL